MRSMAMALLFTVSFAAPAAAQFGKVGDVLKKGAEVMDDLTFTDDEEMQIGSEISAKLRDKYGVVQDPAVHKYVTLVGTLLAQASARPGLKWTFVVLDTDGVNAFAAPGGFVHITRGALALIQSEGELADVLGHEIGHITEKHTINAINKSKKVSYAASATRREKVTAYANQAYASVFENNFDRKDEMGADRVGVTIANKVGYTPAGLGTFLTKLADRNKGLTERSGVFASHPETKARLDGLTKTIAASKLTATAAVAPRYASSIGYKPVPVSAVAQAAPGTAKPQSSSGGNSLLNGLGAVGGQKSGSQTTSSAGSRGVNPDRDAKGGPVKTLVVVNVTAAEVAQFRKGISG